MVATDAVTPYARVPSDAPFYKEANNIDSTQPWTGLKELPSTGRYQGQDQVSDYTTSQKNMADWVKKGSSWTEKKWDDDTKKENKWSEKWQDKSDKWEKTTEKGEPWPTGSSSDSIWTPEKKDEQHIMGRFFTHRQSRTKN